MMRWITRLSVALPFIAVGVLPIVAQARLIAIRPGTGAGGQVNLPYNQPDSFGNQWMLYPGGFLQQQGNNPLFSQGGMIMANNQGVQQNNNQAKLDADTGEVVLENLAVGPIQFTRRVKFDAASGFVRMIDVFKNTTGKEKHVDFIVQSQFHYQMQSGGPIADAKRKGQTVAWVGTTGNQGWRSAVEIYNGKRSRLRTNTGFGTGNNFVSGSYSLLIPAGKEMAIMHFHGSAATPTAGTDYINSLDDRKLLKDVPRNIRKLIVNFGGGETSVGDLEMIRGDLFDVVEITGGDQFKGTIKIPTFKLATAYGPVEFPENRVIAMFNIGQFKARQLIVTTDGQVIGGTLDRQVIDLELSSGQVTKIPLSQITRLGYRKRADEPEEWTFDKPLITLRTGERLFVQMPTKPISFASRYGVLQVDPNSISALSLQTDNSAVHELAMLDGTTLAGLYTGGQIEVIRDGATEPIKIDAANLLKWIFKAPSDDADTAGPELESTNGDHFAATLTGSLHVDTTFDSLELAGEQISHIERIRDSYSDVQVQLWDGATVSGRLAESELPIKTVGGLELKVPLSMLADYTQPLPQPPAAMTKQIESLVKQLNADDWKERDRAQEQLATLGAPVIGVLNKLRASQPAETQQRIDTIVKSLQGKDDKSKPAVNPQPGGVPNRDE